MTEDDRKRAAACGVTPEVYEKAAFAALYYISAHLLRGEPIRLVPTQSPEKAVSLVLSTSGLHMVDNLYAQSTSGCTLEELEARLLLAPIPK